MAKNLTGVQAGLVQENNVNDPTPRVIRGKNQFPQSFQHPSTCLYGLVDVVAAAKCEPGDVFPYKINTDLNTFTLKSPMKSKVTMHTAAFKVPMEALYPRNYELMFPIPNKGSDVPDVEGPARSNRAILNLRRLVSQMNGITSNLISNGSRLSLANAVRLVFLYESIFSTGSIFTKLNIHLDSARFIIGRSSGVDSDNEYIFDDYFDLVFIPELRSSISNYRLVYYDTDEISDILYVSSNPDIVGTSFIDKNGIRNSYISFDRAVELLRSGDWLVSDASFTGSGLSSLPLCIDESSLPEYVNIEHILAYQLSCAHFFNNPKIDYIYTSQLWRDNMEWIRVQATGGDYPRFEWNGMELLYDVVSSVVLNGELSNFSLSSDDLVERFNYKLAFFQNLFGYQNSLRYGDYFVGARPEPIAVGDITIDDPTNPLEITRRLQMTRLLNKVNITGPRKDDYLRVIFGSRIPEAPKDVPIRLTLEDFDVSGFEVNNTGAEQASDESTNITTTNLRLTDSRYMFEVEVDEPCWLIIVQYFDAHRIYSKTIDRFAFHFDRYDDFIPDLQFTGDQGVMQKELLGIGGNDDENFAYNLRYMEYKQRYSYASGGFINMLKSWAMVTDNTDGNPATSHITPSYIRSSPSEFDRFYKSLTGYSLGTRFHFIIMNTNIAVPYRQMVYAPEILA